MTTNPARMGSGSEVLDLDSGIAALQSSPEFSGAVESIEDRYCNDHLALLFESKSEQLATLVPFLRQGLERGERCLVVVDELTATEVLSALREADVDVDPALESGALSFHAVDETYLRNDAFDPDEMVEFYANAIDEATGEYEALRVTAETTWLQKRSTTVEEFMEYEAKVNDLFEGEDCIALCQYDRDAFAAEAVRDIIRTHPHLVYDGTVCHNFYYTPPREFFEPDEAASEVERMMGTLVERAEAKAALEERQRHQRRLYEITADPDRSFDEKLEALFELGSEVFDLEIGGLARVDPADDAFELESTNADMAEFGPGTELPLSETYCKAAADGGTATVRAPDSEGFAEVVVREELDLRTYLGAHLALDSGAERTFFFVSADPRPEPFSEWERTFHHLMAQWVQYELERRQREQYLRESYRITSDPALSFDDKVERLLDLGRERFGLEIGYFTRVDRERDEFEVRAAVGSHDVIGTGECGELSGSYCEAVLETAGPVSVIDAVSEGWADEPAYDRFGLDAYLGTSLVVDGETYGTLCFGSSTSREEPFSEAAYTFLDLMSQWVSYELERRHNEARLAALNETSRALVSAERPATIAETVVDHASSRLDLPLTAVLSYDEETGSLETAAQSAGAEDELPIAALCDRESGPLWNAFVSGEETVVTDRSAYPGTGDAITAILAVPIERRGLFVTATTTVGGFGDAERDFAETTAATVEAAWTRADRERTLLEREATLAEQNEALERLNRVNDIIRNIDQSLVTATSRGDVERVVCEQLADAGPYELAWLGEPDAVTDEVTPVEHAGAERGFLEEISASTEDSPSGNKPAARAIEAREPQVVNDVLSDESFEPWRQAALNRGYHACIALPLAYEGTLYGVLVAYAGSPGVFDDLERSVLTELADTIAYAINAIESKKAIVSDEVTRLEFDVEDVGIPLVELARTFDAEGGLESLVPRTDGGYRAFFSTRGVRAETVLEHASDLSLRSLSLLTSCDEGEEPFALFEAELGEDALLAGVIEHGARPREFTVTDETATVTVELAATAAVREFVDMFRSRYPGSELLAQRSYERSQQTPTEFFADLTETLTDRQMEALQTAYFSGYFEEPRLRSATDIADALGIAQPTFNSHLRAAQQRVCQHLFEDGPRS